MTEVIKYDLALPVTIRKYPVDIEALRSLLRTAKQNSKITNRQLAAMVERPVTEVEHWFRTDNCFSIPDAALWYELKEIIGIKNTDFDLVVTTFEEKDGVFEKANRFYDIEGIAPTLTVASADEKIIVDETKLKERKLLQNTNNIKYDQKEFRYISLFSGIGGFESALNKFGGECVMSSEIDKYANQAYEVLYGNKTVGDITKVDEKDVPQHDLLVGGFPCQAFSVAGSRKGFDDARGTLFFEALRIAKERQPKALLLENVKGLVNHDKGRTLDIMLKALSEVGYTVDFTVLNSKYFGVPQNRERIYIVAIRDDLIESSRWKIEGSNIVAKGKKRIGEYEEVTTFNFEWPQETEVNTRLIDILETKVDEKFYLSEDKTSKLISQLEESYYSTEPTIFDVSQIGHEGKARTYQGVSPTITAREYKEPRMVGHIDLKGHDAIKRVYDADHIAPTLTTMGGGHREPKIAETQEKAKYKIRKLTPKECFRLQAFSDEQFDKLVDAGLSNSQLYKLSGNAVTVNVIEAIGKNLLKFI